PAGSASALPYPGNSEAVHGTVVWIHVFSDLFSWFQFQPAFDSWCFPPWLTTIVWQLSPKSLSQIHETAMGESSKVNGGGNEEGRDSFLLQTFRANRGHWWVLTSHEFWALVGEAEIMRTGADILVDTLIEWGVEVVFGLPGDGINGIMESLRTRQKRVSF